MPADSPALLRRSRIGGVAAAFFRSLGGTLLRGLPWGLHRRFLGSSFLGSLFGGGWLLGLGSFGPHPGPPIPPVIASPYGSPGHLFVVAFSQQHNEI